MGILTFLSARMMAVTPNPQQGDQTRQSQSCSQVADGKRKRQQWARRLDGLQGAGGDFRCSASGDVFADEGDDLCARRCAHVCERRDVQAIIDCGEERRETAGSFEEFGKS